MFFVFTESVQLYVLRYTMYSKTLGMCVAMTDARHASLQGTLLGTRNLVLSHVAVPFPSQGHLLTLHLLAFFYIPEVVQDTPSQLPTLAFCILSHLKEWLCSHNQDV